MWLWSIHSWFHWYKNHKNPLRQKCDSYTVENKVTLFFGHGVYILIYSRMGLK